MKFRNNDVRKNSKETRKTANIAKRMRRKTAKWDQPIRAEEYLTRWRRSS